MKRLNLFLLPVLLLSSCSSQPQSPAFVTSTARAPSSAGQDATLQSFLDSPDPRATAKAFVNRLLRIRIRAQAWLQQFDEALASKSESVDIFRVPAYQRLLVARPISERSEAKIVEIYMEARELAGRTSPWGKSAREQKAFMVVAGIRDALQEVRNNKAQRVLLHDLLTAMKDSFRQKPADQAPEGSLSDDAIFRPIQPEDIGKAAATSAPDIRKMIKDLPETDDVKEEVEAGAAIFEEERRAEELREPSAAKKFPSTGGAGNLMGFEFPSGTFAITFDDGPDRTHTMQILSSLQASGAKGTFFWITNWAKGRLPIVKAVQAAGMTVANHSYMHAKILVPRDLDRLNTTQDKEINTSTDEFTKIFGYKPKYFRLPYAQGMNDARIRAMIAAKGMIHVKWNIDSADWDDKNPATVLARTEMQMRQNGRGIILFHDVHPQSVTASRNLLQRQRGKVRWVTIDEIVNELNR